MDMPECILQQVSRSISGNQWALGPACTCRTLNRLPLPVVKVRTALELWCIFSLDTPSIDPECYISYTYTQNKEARAFLDTGGKIIYKPCSLPTVCRVDLR